MSPLIFLAIAVVVPLAGMAVLGLNARLSGRRQHRADETEPFRRRLEAMAPAELEEGAAGRPTAGSVSAAAAAPPSTSGRPGGDIASEAGETADSADSTPGPRGIRLVERYSLLSPLPPMDVPVDAPADAPSRPGRRPEPRGRSGS